MNYPKIQFLENRLEEVEEFYFKLKSTSQDIPASGFAIDAAGVMSFSRPFFSNYLKPSKNVLISSHLVNHSAFGTPWHQDGGKSMLICSYPHPTQILLPTNEEGKIFNEKFAEDHQFGFSFHPEVLADRLKYHLKRENLYIFTPNLGDVYYLDKSTIHRRNPASKGVHLCLRVWDPELLG